MSKLIGFFYLAVAWAHAYGLINNFDTAPTWSLALNLVFLVLFGVEAALRFHTTVGEP